MSATSSLAPLLADDRALLLDLGRLFSSHGEEIYLVGGSVRDALMGRTVGDLDLTTSADPQTVLGLMRPWAESVWDVGIRYGTVGAQRRGRRIEITTFRADSYAPASRKPDVVFGRSLEDDVARRDFTVNTLAVSLPEFALIDHCDGDRRPWSTGLAHPYRAGGILLRRSASHDARG